MKKQICDKTHSQQCCNRAQKLHNMANILWSNAESHWYLFTPSDSNNITYTTRLVHICNIYPDPVLRQTQITKLVMLVWDERRDSDEWLNNVEAFKENRQDTYFDTDRKLNPLLICISDFLPGAGEPFRVYTNHIQVNLNTTKWHPHDNRNHYKHAWNRLQPWLMCDTKLLTAQIW